MGRELRAARKGGDFRYAAPVLRLNAFHPNPCILLLSLGLLSCSGKSNDDGGAPGGGGADSSGSGGNGIGGGSPAARLPGADGYNCDPPQGDLTPSDLDVTELVSGLDFPVDLTHPPSDARLFIVEQKGAVRIFSEGELLDEPFLDISERVRTEADGGGREQGLLGMAFHPHYQDNGLFYLHYSSDLDRSGDTVIAEYSVSTDENIASAEERVVLTVAQPAGNHNGGSIAFGSDGYLYIALGDGGGGYDSYGNGQDPSTLLGAILRIDPRAQDKAPYGIPDGNLADSQTGAAREVWDYGLRNPYRISFDGCTGDLYIGDVGQSAREELNIERAGEGHKNYGWPIMEGLACTPEPPAEGESLLIPSECGDTLGFTLPHFDYPHTSQAPSVVAGGVYRGSTFPALRGTAFFSDFGSGRMWYTRYDRDADTISPPVELTSALGAINTPGAIANGSDGELYVVSAQDGVVYRLVSSR